MLFDDPDDWLVGDIEIPDGKNDGLQVFFNPHISKGRELEARGLWREAIEEYKKEHDRPIHSHIDADTVQRSYWFKVGAYRELGETEKAIEALQKSRELLKLYGIGPSPNDDLAEIFISQGRLDEAIEMCLEVLERFPAWPTQQLLKKALELKEKRKKGGG
jgi:tetratricopeptide (TPR) repeat protein